MDWYWPLLIAGSIPFYIAVAWAYFGDWHGFVESIRYSLTPDIISLLRGEWEDDQWAQLKLVFYILTCAGITWGVHIIVRNLFWGA
jgi:hypothetical protein